MSADSLSVLDRLDGPKQFRCASPRCVFLGGVYGIFDKERVLDLNDSLVGLTIFDLLRYLLGRVWTGRARPF
jgi:hypothetical protein